jgi:hypothetical protein
MLIAKHSPGVVNAPFCSGLGPSTITTGLIKSSFSLTECQLMGEYANEMKPIGTADYTVILYSASQSCAYGNGAAAENIPKTSKRSGFSIYQTNGVMTQVDASAIFLSSKFSQSLAGIYGSQGQSIATNAFIWASHLEMVLLANNLNASGDYYEGEFPFSSLMDEYGTKGDISIADLIRMSSPRKIEPTLHMTNSMVNNQIPNAAFAYTGFDIESKFATELVSYIVIHRPYTPLEG